MAASRVGEPVIFSPWLCAEVSDFWAVEPQTKPLRKRKRGKVFTAADSTPIQARIPNAMFLEIERAARHELVSIADFVRAALLEKLNRNSAEQKLRNKN